MIGRPQSPALGPRLAASYLHHVVICGGCQPLPVRAEPETPHGLAVPLRTRQGTRAGGAWPCGLPSPPLLLPALHKQCFLGAGREVTDRQLRGMPQRNASPWVFRDPLSCRTLQIKTSWSYRLRGNMSCASFWRVKCLLLCQRVERLQKIIIKLSASKLI